MRTAALVSLLVLAVGCGASSPRVAAERPVDPPRPASTAEPARTCSLPSDCVLVWTVDTGVGVCGAGTAEAMHRDVVPEDALLGPSCLAPTTLLPTCVDARCEVIDVRELPTPESPETSGTVGTCTITLGPAQHWRSWMYVANQYGNGPDEFTRMQTYLEVDITCERATRLSVDGWVDAGGERTAIRFTRGHIDGTYVDPWDGAVPAGETMHAAIYSDDGPWVHDIMVRAFLRWTSDDGATLMLATPEGSVLMVS